MRLAFVLDVDKRGGLTSLLEGLGDDQGQRLTAVENSRAPERSKRYALGRHILNVAARRWRELARIVMREYPQDARESQSFCRVEAEDLSPGDMARHDIAVSQARNAVVGGICCASGDFGGTVDSADLRPDHLDTSAPAAWARARTIARFASSILKSLWPNPLASCSIDSAAVL